MELINHVSRVEHVFPRLPPAQAFLVRKLRLYDLEHVIVRKFI